MVSFSCESCNETMIKKKVAPHLSRCRAPVTCIDCGSTFPGQSFKEHNQCMTESQKYEGKLYKAKAPKQAKPALAPKHVEKVDETKEEPQKVTKADPTPVKVSKPTSLKKLLKKLRKEHKLEKDQLFEKLSVDKDGRLLLL